MKKILLVAGILAGLLIDIGLIATALQSPVGSVSVGHIVYGGLDRSYRVFEPSHLPGAHARAIVFALHGFTGSATSFEGYARLDAEAVRIGAVAVYPEGYAHSWNAGSCCGEAARMQLDDAGFMAALAARLETQYSIDAAQVYAAGFSNGAMLALRVACELPSLFAAVAAVAGELEVQDCVSGPPISTLLVHGTADRLVQFPGYVAGTDTRVFDWALSRARCSSSSVVVKRHVTVLSAHGCPQSVAVTEYELAGGAHEWPDTSDIRTSAVVGSFFAAKTAD